MILAEFRVILVVIQQVISFLGIMIILSGVLMACAQYVQLTLLRRKMVRSHSHGAEINDIRLNLGRILILGLEFIVAADLISTTTTPDYYAVGIVAIIVAIRTLLSFSLNKEIMSLSKEK